MDTVFLVNCPEDELELADDLETDRCRLITDWLKADLALMVYGDKLSVATGITAGLILASGKRLLVCLTGDRFGDDLQDMLSQFPDTLEVVRVREGETGYGPTIAKIVDQNFRQRILPFPACSG
ncbi:MAG: hypothetical protein AAB468_02540 [Patescibacteria group bacterium]